jgi:hypothetical protein
MEVNELVVLKPEIDDSNYKRVYEIVEKRGDEVWVTVVSERATSPDKSEEKSDIAVPGLRLGPFEERLFQSYQ